MRAAHDTTLRLGSLALALLHWAVGAGESAPMTHPLPARADTVSGVADALQAQVTFEMMFVELTSDDARALTMDRFLHAAPDASSAKDVPSKDARFLTLHGLLRDPQFRQALDALDEPGTNSMMELRGDQLDWGGKRLTNAANIRLSAELGATAAVVLDEPQYRLLLRALEQRPDARVLSAPRITIAGGQQTRIHLVEVTNVHIAINPDAIVRRGIWGQTNIPIYTSASIPVGPSVDLLPAVRPDAATVELTVRPTRTHFVGYDPPWNNNQVQVWKKGVKKRVNPPLPRFRVYQTEAAVSVSEGGTVMVATPPVTDSGIARGADPGSTRRTVRPTSRPPERTAYHRLLIFLTPRVHHAAASPPPTRASPGAPPGRVGDTSASTPRKPD